LGSGLGLLLGGVLVQAVSWRWAFFVNVPTTALVAALAPRYIPCAQAHRPARRGNRNHRDRLHLTPIV
jgi:MFS family permease